MKPLDVVLLEREIEALITQFPELAEDEDLRRDVLAGQTNFEECLESVVERHLMAEAMVDAIKARIAVLEARSASYEAQSKAMKALAYRLQSMAEIKTLPLPSATLTIKRLPPQVIVADESLIPKKFFKSKTVETLDRTALKAALESGEEVEGAHLSNGGETIQIRTK